MKKTMKFLARTDKTVISEWWWTVDKVMLACLLSIMAFGVILVAAASPAVAERIGASQHMFIIKHIVFLIPAIGLMIGMSLCSLTMLWRIALITFGLGVIALLFVPVFGPEIKGAQRWLPFIGFSLQPSEFVKPAFIVAAAGFIARQKEHLEFPGYKIAGALYVVFVVLLVLQPDMGMTFLVTCCFLAIIFLAGLPLRWVILLGGAGMIGILVAYAALPHFQSRIDRFLDPSSGDTYQVQRSLAAFENGGIFGTGPGQGTVKLHLPDAHADFIFSVAGEELGLIFVLLIVGLYAYVLVRGFNRIMDSGDLFVVLATGGLLTQFGLQALVHMGSALSILPTKGMTLPFISYGGSSLMAMGMAMGMVLALTRRQSRQGIARSGLSIRPVGGKS